MAHHNGLRKTSALLLALMLLSTHAMADSRLFDKVHKNDTITMVLPNGECDAKVVKRELDELTVRLKETTQTCGPRDSLVTVSRIDVQDVVDERPYRHHPGPGLSPAGVCTVTVAVAVMATAGQYVGETAGDGPGLAVTGGGVVAGAALCHSLFSPHGPRYSVFTVHITLVQP